MYSVVMYNHAAHSTTHQRCVVMYSVVMYNQAVHSATHQHRVLILSQVGTGQLWDLLIHPQLHLIHLHVELKPTHTNIINC